jgi:ABC-2 type transport system ATP-binding protein
MEEAEVLCDRIAIMERGKILAMDDTHRLMNMAEYPYTVNFVKENVPETTINKLDKLGKVENLFGKNNHFIVRVKEKKDSDEAIKIVESIKPETITSGRATLEDLFIELTGKTIED